MKRLLSIGIMSAIVLMIMASCKQNKETNAEQAEYPAVFQKENLVAWCVVPFDSKKRGPVERVNMLDELGIERLAWDWRTEHVPTFGQEIKLLTEKNIKLQAVWMWINGGDGPLIDDSNNKILETLENNNVRTEVWMSFNNSFFDGLSDEDKLDKAIEAVSVINERVDVLGCKLALYNHGEWFGDPLNQIRIIEAVGSDNIGIVYNFHHAHHEIEKFPELLKKMMPHLLCINLNGMRKDGEKILPLGSGDHELGMIQAIVDAGYDGPLGVLGHVDDRDVKEVLEENMKGLNTLAAQIK